MTNTGLLLIVAVAVAMCVPFIAPPWANSSRARNGSRRGAAARPLLGRRARPSHHRRIGGTR